jgi:hypothetical protein
MSEPENRIPIGTMDLTYSWGVMVIVSRPSMRCVVARSMRVPIAWNIVQLSGNFPETTAYSAT